MNIPFEVKKAGVVFGLAFVLFWLLRPGSARKPKTTKEVDPVEQKKNANIVIDAYINAVKAGETPAALEELNKLTEKTYGLRVYKKPGDGKYYVRDDNGNDVKLK